MSVRATTVAEVNADPTEEPTNDSGAPRSAPQPVSGAEPAVGPTAAEFDDAVTPDLDLVQPALDLARTTTEAVQQLVDVQQQTLVNLAQFGHTLQDGQQQLAQAAADVAASADAWRRFQERGLQQVQQARDAITPLISGIWSWIKRGAAAAGEAIGAFYLRCAPPNWTTDPTAAVVDYVGAVRLALDEGIPLAWVPDQETVHLLLAVRGSGDGRRTQLHRILDDRRSIILDFCKAQLDQIANGSAVSADGQQMVAIARQSIEALRLGLTAPAQSAATALIDHLLWDAFTTVHGDYKHASTRQRVEELSQLIDRMSVTFLSALRELATMMPVFTAWTPWRPGSNTPPPTTFSRHVTTHHIAASDQVSPVNALTAVMLAVSLLSQRYNSGWISLATLRFLDARIAARNPD